jgi:hypothetical protein
MESRISTPAAPPPTTAMRTGKSRHALKIDVAVVKAVMPCDETGQHAGISGVTIRADEGDADLVGRPQAETAQYFDVAVAAAQQQQTFQCGWSSRRRLFC